MEITAAEILQLLEGEFRCASATVDGTHVFELSSSPPNSVTIADAELSALIEEVCRLEQVDSTSVATPTEYQILLQRAVPIRYLIGAESLQVVDVHQGLTYEIGKPTAAFVIMILLEADRQEGPNRPRPLARAARGRRRLHETETVSLSQCMDDVTYMALRIESAKAKALTSWRRYADAFLFHLGYNLDAALVPRPWKGEPARPTRMRRMGGPTLADLDVPRRLYRTELVHHYQLGISAESPMLRYICFYQVAEYWFERIYEEDLVDQVQASITSPSFSFRRKRDIAELIKQVSKAVQVRNDELAINEQVALRLTLQKYVDLGRLATELGEFDERLIDYLASTKVPFSDGDPVRLVDNDPMSTYSSLSRRIYKTRNAIMHSKDGAKSRFVPFADDHALLPEIPLMRLIAEQIIVATSEQQPI
jgi:hypothetical protein